MKSSEPSKPTDPDVARSWSEAAATGRTPLIVLESLVCFMDEAGLGSGAIWAQKIGDGHSNVTFEVIRDDLRAVLRRPPRPPFPPSAHDVLREARLLRALEPVGARVPRVLATCDDTSILGAPFYIMDYVDGDVFGDLDNPPIPEDRRMIGEEMVDALADLHAVDITAPALQTFGRPDGYLARQLRRFGSIWQNQRTRDIPEMASVAVWLDEHIPESALTTLVHGDYRLGNVMFSRASPRRLVAMLDWEMATIGDPLADIGYLCATWARPEDPDNPMLALSAVTRLPGFATPDELLHRYSLATGRDVEQVRWYEVLALWKSAIFLESSFRRFQEGTTEDPYFEALANGVPRLVEAALERTRGHALGGRAAVREDTNRIERQSTPAQPTPDSTVSALPGRADGRLPR